MEIGPVGKCVCWVVRVQIRLRYQGVLQLRWIKVLHRKLGRLQARRPMEWLSALRHQDCSVGCRVCCFAHVVVLVRMSVGFLGL